MKKLIISLLASILVFGNCFAYAVTDDIKLFEDNNTTTPTNNNHYIIQQENFKQDNRQIPVHSVMVPANLQVPFNVKNVYSSKTLTTNTKIDIVVANDVWYENHLIFRRGNSGYMYPSYVNKAGKFGNNGKIHFESAYVKDVNGNEQLLDVESNIQCKKIIYGSWGFLSNSQNAEIGPGTLFNGKIVNSFPFKLQNYNTLSF